jgi:tetratricopeptide (TPR) repeat protein
VPRSPRALLRHGLVCLALCLVARGGFAFVAPDESGPAPAEPVTVLDNALLDRLFGAARDRERKAEPSRASEEPARRDGHGRFFASVQPHRALTAAITRRTPARRAAALRLGESGRRLLQAGRHEEALHRLETALALDPDPYLYYYLALAHFRRANHLASLEFLDVAHAWLNLDPEWVSALDALRHENARALKARATKQEAAREKRSTAPAPPARVVRSGAALLFVLGAIALAAGLALARGRLANGWKTLGLGEAARSGIPRAAAFFSALRERGARGMARLLRWQRAERR